MNAQRLGLVAWILLILLQPAWYLCLAPPASAPPWLALALTLPPLLLPALALRGGLPRTLLWVGMVALFYFCHGIVAAWVVPATRVPAIAEALLSALLVLSLGFGGRGGRTRVSAP
jgi:uncharacterized membrane protein